jgi:hypothetical protein
MRLEEILPTLEIDQGYLLSIDDKYTFTIDCSVEVDEDIQHVENVNCQREVLQLNGFMKSKAQLERDEYWLLYDEKQKQKIPYGLDSLVWHEYPFACVFFQIAF